MEIKKINGSKIIYFGVGFGILLIIIGGILAVANWEFGIVKWEAIAQDYWYMLDVKAFYEEYTARLITGFVLVICGIIALIVTNVLGKTIRNADSKNPVVGTTINQSITDELIKSKKLLDEGAITIAEYDALKRRLLSSPETSNNTFSDELPPL